MARPNPSIILNCENLMRWIQSKMEQGSQVPSRPLSDVAVVVVGCGSAKLSRKVPILGAGAEHLSTSPNLIPVRRTPRVWLN